MKKVYDGMPHYFTSKYSTVSITSVTLKYLEIWANIDKYWQILKKRAKRADADHLDYPVHAPPELAQGGGPRLLIWKKTMVLSLKDDERGRVK